MHPSCHSRRKGMIQGNWKLFGRNELGARLQVSVLWAIHLWRPHGGGGARFRWMHVDGGGVKPHVDVPFSDGSHCWGVWFQIRYSISCRNLSIAYVFIVLWGFHDNSSTDISSTTLRLQTFRIHRVGQSYIQLLFQQIIVFINSNFYLHYDSFLSIPLPLTLWYYKIYS